MGKGSVQLLLGPSSGLRKVVPNGKQMFSPGGPACGARQLAAVESTGETGGLCRRAPGGVGKRLGFWRSQALMIRASSRNLSLQPGGGTYLRHVRIRLSTSFSCKGLVSRSGFTSAATVVTHKSGIG